jgi:hypothetical protein
MKHLSALIILLLGLTMTAPHSLWSQCNFGVAIEISPEAPQNVYCPYDTVKLSVEGAFDSYQWYLNYDGSANLTLIEGATEASLLIPISEYGFGYFFVELTRDDCTEVLPPVVLDSWVFSFPAIEHSPQNQYCHGDSTIISNAFGSYPFYQWYRDWVLIPGANEAQYVVRQSGTYTLEVAPAACPQLTLSSGVGPTFNFSGPAVPVITEVDGVLVSSSGPFYQWLLNGEPIAGANSAAYEPSQSGVYTVEVSDGGVCRPISAPFDFQVTSTREPSWATGFSFFPNPVQDVLQVKAPATMPYRLRLLNAAGQEVLRLQHPGTGAYLQVSLAHLPEGIYIGQIYYQGELANYRIVLAKP